jgi:high-affinity nickel-transport protein
LATRPLLVGVLHGLAGSGGLTALALVQSSTGAGRVAAIGLFGLGSALGMALLTGLLGVPLAAASARPWLARRLALAAGVASTAVGAWWGVHALSQLGG